MSQMPKKPVVSVLCLSYNQKKYIRQMLDSILMQKTNFDFEVLINDDASTDGTAEIIKEYQSKYPDIIKPVFHKKNLYSQGIRSMVTRFLLPKAEGKYIALCEGDDYWTDSNKLRLQVDFLDKHKDYALCFHSVKVFFENKEQQDYIFPDPKRRSFAAEELLRSNFIHTNSVMYRKQKYKNMATSVMPGDWYLHLYHAQFGKIGFIDKPMSVYRRHSGGIWWDSYHNREKFWIEHGMAHLALYEELLKIYGHNEEHERIILAQINNVIQKLAAADRNKKTGILKKAILKYPDNMVKVLLAEIQVSSDREADIIKLEKKVAEMAALLSSKDEELKALKSSRIRKTRNYLARAVSKKQA